MRKLFVLLVLVGAVALGWHLREHWVGDDPTGPSVAVRTEGTGPTWQPLEAHGAARARAAVERLQRRNGPAYVHLAPGDLAALVLEQIARALPRSADSVQAAVIEELYHVRASISLDELGGAEVLGPLAGLLSDRETVELGGSFDVIRPGLAQYRVQRVRLGQFVVPERLVPRLVRRLRRGEPVEGLAEDGIAIQIPRYVGDVRIADGRVTLYRAVE